MSNWNGHSAEPATSDCGGGSHTWNMRPVDRRNARRYGRLSVLMGTSLIAASAILTFTDLTGPLAWTVAAAPFILCLVTIHAFMRLLKESDELTRRLHLESIAAGFAVGVVAHIGMQALGWLGVPASPLFNSIELALMLVSYSFVFVMLARRYR